MKEQNRHRPIRRRIRRVDIQVSLFMAVMVLVTTLFTFGLSYEITYADMITSLRERVQAIYTLLDGRLDESTFRGIDAPEDMASTTYRQTQQLLRFVRESTGVLYLYTAKQNERGELVYVVDGLSEEEDFRYPGDRLEPEIEPAMRRALAGENVLPDHIQKTDWGKIFITYLPIHGEGDSVLGVVGIEFDAEHQYNTYLVLRRAAPGCIVLLCLVSVAFAVLFFRRVSNPTYQDMANTDQLTGLKSRNAFEVDLKNAIAGGAGRGSGLLVADLDYLKQVNDTLGHAVGDRYIQRAAEALRQALGSRAALYRVGGDEFAALYAHASAEQLERDEEAIKWYFEELREDWPVETSLSIGGAMFDPAQDDDLHGTYRRADAGMYEQKRESHSREECLAQA